MFKPPNQPPMKEPLVDEHRDDELARLRAEMDQAKESGRDIAAGAWAFYSGAVDSGFNVEQAFELTCSYLHEIFHAPKSDDA